VSAFNTGFGRALGEFALILLPSFTLAAALSRQNIASNVAGRTVALASPVAGAGMICPDTAYAALSPAAGRYKMDTAFGAYAGFKLLYPAGPLIVAAGLGVTGSTGISSMQRLSPLAERMVGTR
jgi:GntP family gluconate:H+ symporter